jgi:hypothetical protein
MIKQIVFQFRFLRAIRRARRDGSTEAVKKLFAEYPEMKARFPDAQFGQWLHGIEESRRLVELSQRPRQYSVTCGTGELACGLMWFGMAGGGMWSLLMPASVGEGYIGMGITIVCFLAGGFLLLAGNRLVVHPRVGYFAMRPEKSRWVGMIVGTAVSGIVAVVISLWWVKEHAGMAPSAIHPVHLAASNAATNSPVMQTEVIIMAVTGVLNALLYLMVNAVSIKQLRWKWACLAVLLLIPPAMIFWLPADMAHRQLPMNFLQSLIWLVSGSATLIWFIRHHQPPAPDAE